MMYVIRFKNNLTKTYYPYIFIKDDFKSYTKMLHDTMIVHPDKLIEQDMHICTVSLIGYYDQETGVLSPADGIQEYNLQEAFDQRKALEAVNHVN